ncbi:YpiF family protein [Solibacillus sp. FSL H8-0538]|uniref:YpiF family protein n=1 Tax=Solibacillus sp. FSL H8-0538 TaxID=2921400 RepID=UPI0030F9D9D5
MIFNVKDVEQFQEQKQFIDTAIVPLVSLDLSNEGMKQSSSKVEYLMSLTAFVEHQFKGRLMLTPPFSYTDNTRNDTNPVQIKSELHAAGFKTVFFMTCDHYWTSKQNEIEVIWLPSIPLESMDKAVKQRILEDQLKQVIPILTKAWSQQ